MIRLFFICVCLTFLLSHCFLKQDRTTVVYGTITDEKGQPVDSILVVIKGAQGFKYERLKEVYSGKDGSYELVVDVPRKYGSANVTVPFGSYENPKYDKNYKGKRTFKNDQFTKNCCSASIGNKTKYDFQLIPK
ncbi:carboxypeptidase regulatory-like domain-containing protein [Dyadobacter aurulentus]|uniref:carboxypeptidase regulatory-like domain-containing protein n=1 Tax=Dyadobacter sp. UC 10 TaxID=2605428 RepID=UPI0011F2A565|nr:carboxypeptidase regulatory-like domain-containing protein [Dyadobacter sp. UC 10]KAA0991871.1 carboxypeptidase regulatory-like domain-containing protein [Dyadobacter sp. UC 10]